MRANITRLGMAAAVAECIELLDISKLESGLLGDPLSQADFQSPVLERREGTERQRLDDLTGFVLRTHDQDDGLVLLHGEDRCIEADLDSRHLVPLPYTALARLRSSSPLQVSFEGHRRSPVPRQY